MIVPVPQDYNRNNLIEVMTILKDLSPFPFFGTLLGLVRENDIIDSDDDIDIYLEVRNRDVVIERMVAGGFNLRFDGPPNHTPFFLQFTKYIDDIETYIDIYFYERDYVHGSVVERWNFFGQPEDPNSHLYIDEDLIFPLQKKLFFGLELQIPANEKEICAFLYGPNWSVPVSKAKGDYTVRLHENKPVFIRRGEYTFQLLSECEGLRYEVGVLRNYALEFKSIRDLFGVQGNVFAEEWSRLAREMKSLGEGQSLVHEEIERLTAGQSQLQDKFDQSVIHHSTSAEEYSLATREARALREEQALLRVEVERLAVAQAVLQERLDESSRDVNGIMLLQSRMAEETQRSREGIERMLSLAVADRAVLHRLECRSAEDRELAIEALQADVARALKAHRGRIWSRRRYDPMPELREAARKLTRMGFNSEAYSKANPDVAAAQFDPAQHYLIFGRAEGRDPFFR